MPGMLIIGFGTALAGFVILAKTYAGGPHKAEKSEKAEIIRQLLALSEQENRALAIVSRPARNPQLAPPSVTPRDASRKGTFLQHKPGCKNSHTNPANPLSLKDRTDAKIDQDIRRRAYQLYQERGGGEGSATDDWLQAKKDVLSQKANVVRDQL